MKAYSALPEGYSEIFSLDLQKNKKANITVNLLAVIIGVLMIVPMHFYIPITELFSYEQGESLFLIRFFALLILSIVYIVLHEMVHGIAMKICGTKKVKYGFVGQYAFAGSEDYYNKKAYIFIALAPIIFWGIVLLIVQLFVPAEWFWIIYLIQVFNISGAAGDLYVTVLFSRMPKDILIYDYGVGMSVFSKE